MGVKIPLLVGNFVHESLRLNQSSDVVCLLEWWAANCSITESLPELIQQVRQDLTGALGAEL